ncbi:MAG: hypothetical protein ACK4Y9_07430 [Hyphomonas sp.]
MINLAALHRVRKHPTFAGYFDAVLPIFWPVVFWYLLRVADQMDAHGNCDVLVQVHWWGRIDITYYGDPAPSPSAYRPIPPMRKAWDDPTWATAIPAGLCIEPRAVIFPCFSGGSGRAQSALTKGACALTAKADTS